MRRVSWLYVMPLVIGSMFASAGGCTEESTSSTPAPSPQCCDEFRIGTDMSNVDWGGDAKFGLLAQAAGDLMAATNAITDELGIACMTLAMDLGESGSSVNETEPCLRTEAWCDRAAARIIANSGALAAMSMQAASCTVPSAAQAQCETRCSPELTEACKIELGDIALRCAPDALIVQCEGSCSGRCRGSASVAVVCDGTCSGTCDGECEGVQGSGPCASTCKGQCRGECDFADGTETECDGECVGGCSGIATAHRCAGPLGEPSVGCAAQMGEACAETCAASAAAKGFCRPGMAEVAGSGDANPKVIATLKMNLPALLAARARLEQLMYGWQSIGGVYGGVPLEGADTYSTHACFVPVISAFVGAADCSARALDAVATATVVGGL